MIGPSVHLQRLGQLSGVCPATGVQARALGPPQRPVCGLQRLHHHQPRHRLLCDIFRNQQKKFCDYFFISYLM